MECPHTFEMPMLDIEKAMKATQDYVSGLEELKREGLTAKQASALARFTQESRTLDCLFTRLIYS